MLVSSDNPKSGGILSLFAGATLFGEKISFQSSFTTSLTLTSSSGQDAYTSLSASLIFLAATKDKQALSAEAADALLLVAQLHNSLSLTTSDTIDRVEKLLAQSSSPFFANKTSPGVIDVAAAAAIITANNQTAELFASTNAPRLRALAATVSALQFFQDSVATLAAESANQPASNSSSKQVAKAGATRAGGGGGVEGSTAKASSSKGGKDTGAPSAAVAALASYVTSAPVDVRSIEQMSSCILHELGILFYEAIESAFPQAKSLGIESADIQVNPGISNGKFVHHYQCNSALPLFALLRGPSEAKKEKKAKTAAAAAAAIALDSGVTLPPPTPAPVEVVSAPPAPAGPPPPASPVAVANTLIAALLALGPHYLIGKVEASGPGYINIYLASNYMSARLAFLLTNGIKASPSPGPNVGGKRRKVAVDYSSPNIAKEMHVGHLRSTIIGDTISRILEFCGHEVVRINHVGDWGTQFGMLIAHLKDLLASGKVTDSQLDASIGDLSGFYKAAKKRFDAEPDFKKRAHENVVALQAGDAVNLAYWRRMVSVSEKMFKEVYSRLSVDPRLELKGESFYNGMIPGVIAELESKGLLSNSSGALVCTVQGHEVPLMVRKSDGGFGYDSTDLAAIRYRLCDLACDWLIYVVDAGQSLHFDLVFKGAQLAGWYTPATWGPHQKGISSSSSTSTFEARVDHCAFGVVQSKDDEGNVTKFKTRSGDTVRLIEVLDTARAKARSALEERAISIGGVSPFSSPETAAAAEAASAVLGYGGVQYFDLRQSRTSDYIFDYDRMLSADGDTAMYLEYAHARVASILRKAKESAGIDVDAIVARAVSATSVEEAASLFQFQHASELTLASDLMRVQDVLSQVQIDLFPHRLCEYLYFLSGRMTDFYRDCVILGEGTPIALRDSRLRLCSATASVLKQGMGLLGITALDRI